MKDDDAKVVEFKPRSQEFEIKLEPGRRLFIVGNDCAENALADAGGLTAFDESILIM